MTETHWQDTKLDGKELSRFLAAQFNIHIHILPLLDRSVHAVDVGDYSNDELLNGQTEFCVIRVYYCTNSDPPANP